jgi:hypothetical protein
MSRMFAVSINAGFGAVGHRRSGPHRVGHWVRAGMDLPPCFAESLADDIWNQRHQVVINRFAGAGCGH